MEGKCHDAPHISLYQIHDPELSRSPGGTLVKILATVKDQHHTATLRTARAGRACQGTPNGNDPFPDDRKETLSSLSLDFGGKYLDKRQGAAEIDGGIWVLIGGKSGGWRKRKGVSACNRLGQFDVGFQPIRNVLSIHRCAESDLDMREVLVATKREGRPAHREAPNADLAG